MTTKLQSIYGLKFNPFRPDLPVEALYTSPAVDAFLRRQEMVIKPLAPYLASLPGISTP